MRNDIKTEVDSAFIFHQKLTSHRREEYPLKDNQTIFNMPVSDPSKISKVVVHPLVLLSVVDHFNRMGKVGNAKRVVGVLLGSNRQGVLDVSNSFAGCYICCLVN